MDRTLRAAIIAAVLVGASQPAAAQGREWTDRVFTSVSFGFEGGTAEVADNRTFTVYGEDATISSKSRFKTDGIIDVAAGVRAWRNLGVALAYHAESTTGTADVQGSIPHPIFFDRPRNFSENIDGIDRDEQATHLQIGWMVPFNDKLDVFLYAGPSFFRLSQELIVDVTVAEQPPAFTNVVVQANVDVRKRNTTGYNVGADVSYMLYSNDSVRLGVGGFLRLTRATADIALANSSVETTLGGVQAGIGARVRF
ncbi:MAG: hypothetical protein IT180_15355 [Acidobacteria bacterium]|nr:hypothetical protein [Acidobacteriota bacterium]HQZ40688.1 hypothetical protein [Vicinamibacterales bacterium]